jgi:PAS domain S-box-containing protein
LLSGFALLPEPSPEPGVHTSQRALRGDRDAYRAVFDACPVPMLVCEVGTLRVLAANVAAAKLHGASPELVEGRTLFDLRRLPELTGLMLERALGREVALGFGYHLRKDGTTFPVQLTVHPSELFGSPAWLCVLKSMEEVLAPREAAPRPRYLEAVGRVAGGVAHDLSELLSIIVSRGTLAASQLPGSSPLLEELAELRAAAERAALLTKQLLGLTRRGSATSSTPVDLNEVVRRAEPFLRRVLGENVELGLELAPDLDLVLADPARVEQLLVQLLAESRGGSATVCIETRNVEVDGPQGCERHVMLLVTDGGGFPAAEVAAWSELVSTGSAWMESEPGGGSRCVTCLPSLRPRTVKSSAVQPRPRRETVLIVQDNPHLRKTLRTYFAREGFRVLDADSGRQALRVAEQNVDVDLLVTDVVLTDGSGRELNRALRERLPSLRTLISIGNAEQGATLSLDERTALISKPFDLREFGALVERLLAQPDLT